MQPPSSTRVVSWKRNLAAMGLAQAASSMGISFMYPFLPLFVQELGARDARQAALWAGIASGISGIPMLFSGPMWGMLADRYGRKKNVLRAMFGSAAAVALQAVSANIFHLTLFRFLYGVLTGVHAAGQALVASSMPRERMAFGLGVLQATGSAGNTIGPAIGAVAAAAFGMRGAFFVAAGLLSLGGLVVLLAAQEDLRPSPRQAGTVGMPRSPFRSLVRLMTSRRMLPLLATLFITSTAPAMNLVALPLLLSELSGGRGASATGAAFTVLGLTGALSAYVSGRLSRRVGLVRLLIIACGGLALAYLPLTTLHSIPLIFAALVLAGLCQGALSTSAAGLVGLRAPREQHGAVFGGVQSITFVGFTLGPFVGGVIANLLGLRAVYLVLALALTGAATTAAVLLGRSRTEAPEARTEQVPTEQGKEPRA